VDGFVQLLLTGDPELASNSRGAQTGRLPCSLRPPSTIAQVCSSTAQARAATAQSQRRKWKLLMSRFRY